MKNPSILKLYHGSSHIIETPIFGKGKKTNDYGRGFYMTENIDLAKEWACNNMDDGVCNKYILDIKGLKLLDLNGDNYNILNWITILIKNRIFDITNPLMKKRKNWIIKNYDIDMRGFDFVKGYRADDSYFSFAKSFLNNEININQLRFAMNLGSLGTQYMLLSRRAFEAIKYEGYEIAMGDIYFYNREARDKNARDMYTKILEIEDFESPKLDDLIKNNEKI